MEGLRIYQVSLVLILTIIAILCTITSNMKINEVFIEQFNKMAKNQNFVFDECDLKSLFDKELDQSFYRLYKRLFEMGMLKRFCKGIYVAKEFNLVDVNKKIKESSYISFEYVLAQNAIIGTYSNKIIRSVMVTGKTKKISYQGYRLEQYKINKELFFGFNNIGGYNIATPEKAYLDCLYYYMKGLRFSFDPFSDVDIQLFDQSLIIKYLKKYKNKKFVTFVKGLLPDD